jgi:hypothetical protein
MQCGLVLTRDQALAPGAARWTPGPATLVDWFVGFNLSPAVIRVRAQALWLPVVVLF